MQITMKRVAAILFLWIYLVANTELHQFLRLPVFFAHYQEHRAENPYINLIDFISQHYFADTNNVGKDDQLPFKDKCPEVSLSIAMPPEILPETTLPDFTVAKNIVMFKTPFIASSFHFSIWQPPRA
jgi:hypothetical protein